jgi:polysaccharide biosynthesis/export protein
MDIRTRYSPLKPALAIALLGGLNLPLTLGWTTPAQAAMPTAMPPKFMPLPPAPVINDDGYILGPGDRIKLDIFSVPEFSGEYTVLPNGAINLPQVGMLMLQGLTTEQASNLVVKSYGAILTRPIINFNVTGMRPMTIAIAGEVERPGAYSLSGSNISSNIGNNNVGSTGSSGSDAPTLSRAIQIADGVTRSADLRKVQIRRQRAGKQGDDIITVNLLQLVQFGDARQDIRLRDGDSILIPAGDTIDITQTKQLMASNFAGRNQRPIQVAVIGEVGRPGPHLLSLVSSAGANGNSASTGVGGGGVLIPKVTQAIQQAGGISPLADIRNVQVRRLTRSGTEQSIKVDFWKLLRSGDLNQDVPLQEGDMVEIPTATAMNDAEITALATTTFSPDKMTVSFAGEVERPGSLVLPPNTPLNQALLTAGGFNLKSAKNSVTLIRLNPNGSVTKRDVPIDFAQNVNEANNPPLRNNDIVVVRKSGVSTLSDGLNQFLSPFTGIFSIFRLFGG